MLDWKGKKFLTESGKIVIGVGPGLCLFSDRDYFTFIVEGESIYRRYNPDMTNWPDEGPPDNIVKEIE